MKKIFLLGLIIRLICTYLFRNVNNYDLQSYLQVGELTLKGINIYPDVANLHYPYLPFFLYLEAIALYLEKLGGFGRLGAIVIIKSINIIFDLAILQLIYLMSKKNLKTAFYYAINPVTILVTTLHGQFDVIPLFFLLLSIYFLNKKQELSSVLYFSISVLIKTWPLLFAIPIFKRLGNKQIIILTFLFPLISVVVYSVIFHTFILNISKTILLYQGLWGIWGVGKLFFFPLRILFQKIITFTFIASFILYSFKIRCKSILDEILILLIFFFIFTTNFAIQYFVWLIPFLILSKSDKNLRLIILITLYLLVNYLYWFYCSNCKLIPNWLIIAQNISSFVLWLYFIKTWYISRMNTLI